MCGGAQANTFVAAFYDAVLLYADALNRTLSAGFNATDGDEIKRRMWNRTFPSIAGNAIIDKNGDRHADYSLLDYNPASGQFEARTVPATRCTRVHLSRRVYTSTDVLVYVRVLYSYVNSCPNARASTGSGRVPRRQQELRVSGRAEHPLAAQQRPAARPAQMRL